MVDMSGKTQRLNTKVSIDADDDGTPMPTEGVELLLELPDGDSRGSKRSSTGRRLGGGWSAGSVGTTTTPSTSFFEESDNTSNADDTDGSRRYIIQQV